MCGRIYFSAGWHQPTVLKVTLYVTGGWCILNVDPQYTCSIQRLNSIHIITRVGCHCLSGSRVEAIRCQKLRQVLLDFKHLTHPWSTPSSRPGRKNRKKWQKRLKVAGLSQLAHDSCSRTWVLSHPAKASTSRSAIVQFDFIHGL